MKLKVVTSRLVDLCTTIVAELKFLREIRVGQMEDPKLKKIHDNLATKSNSEFRLVDGVLKFQNRIFLPDVVDIKQQIMNK